MSDVIISAENVGKSYTLDHRGGGGGYRKFSDTLIHTAKAPLRWLKTGNGEPRTAESKEEFWALKDVSFEIKRGEVVGIIGRNGAGKSTLLKILSRITEPTKGRITLDGRVASLLEVGTGFHPELTGRENIYLNGAILGMRKDEIRSKFDEIVAFAEIEKFLDTPVKRYSSGMYVRLAFAVAAHLEPEILIVDEVLAVGDAQFQAKCLGKMQDVARGGGRTVLFVSHNMEAVKKLCGRGIFLTAGEITASGPISEVASLYMKQGNGSVGMVWHRGDARSELASIMCVEACVEGQQPELKLAVRVEIASPGVSGGLMLALDISDDRYVPLMQALPRLEPFFGQHRGRHQITMEVALPPLIPGKYYVSVWIGRHFSLSVEFLESVVSFEVVDSPLASRSFPHSIDHGSIAPACSLQSLKSSSDA